MITATSPLALQRIQENLETQALGKDASFLDLGNCGLTQLPDELLNLKHLRSLNLGSTYNKVESEDYIAIYNSANNGTDNQISIEEIQKLGKHIQLNELFLAGLNLKSILGIEVYKNLLTLDISKNIIANIEPLINLDKLQNLFMSDNLVSEIYPLEKIKSLKILNASKNKITDINPLSKHTKMKLLYLNENAIRDVSPIVGFTKLKQLILSNNSISSIDKLANLKLIEKLDFSNNLVSDLTPLKDFNKLEDLSAYSNMILKIDEIALLDKLINLDLSNNNISNIPKHVKWINMQFLKINNNKIDNVDGLINVTSLVDLSLSENHISDFPQILFDEIRNLNLSNNQFVSVKDFIYLGKMERIEVLDISNNKIKHLKPLAQGFPINFKLITDGNPIEDIPKEIVASGNFNEIRAFFRLPTDQISEHIAEIKLILVGNSTSGKTTLSRILRNKVFQANEPSTHGIQINQWRINKRDIFDADLYPDAPEKIMVNIWDFGGQEYYHGTHQLFLDNNAIYLLIWEPKTNFNNIIPTEYPREGETTPDTLIPVEQFNIQYWLDSIRFYAAGNNESAPPVFLVQNKLDREEGKETWPDPVLLREYQVADALALSASLARSKTPSDRLYNHRFQIFRDKLLSQIRQKAMENMQRDRLPLSWQRIRAAIHEATDKESSQKTLADNPFARRADESQSLDGHSFREACREVLSPQSITDDQIDTLVQYLNRVGALYYNQAVEDRIFLRPTLLTEKIYQVLNKDVLQRKGRFTQQDVTLYFDPKAGPDEQRRKASMLTGLMARWEIIFPAPIPPPAPSSALPAPLPPPTPSSAVPAASVNTTPTTGHVEWIATQYLPDEHPLEGLYQIASSGLERCFVVQCPLFHYKKALRQLILAFGNDSQVGNKEFWKNGILFSTSEDNLRVLIKGIRNENAGKIKVCVEHRSGFEDQTRNWEKRIFEEIIKAVTEHSRQPFSTFNTTGRSGEGAEVYNRRAERAAGFMLSRNEKDYVRIKDLLDSAQKGSMIVFSMQENEAGGKNFLSMKEFEAFLPVFGQSSPRPTIFFSYSHDNAAQRKELETYLAPVIKRLKQADAWYDGLIKPGEYWDETIKTQLRQADVVLLLISAAFIDSDYSWENEIQPALERHRRGEARVIPILLSDCLWQGLPFAELEMIPKEPQNARLLAMEEWPNRARAFTTVAKRIQEVLEEMKIL
jgi:Leucine-rich repeat (LRR) protein